MGTLVLGKSSVPAVFEETMIKVLRPALKSIGSWGELDKSPHDKENVKTFLDRVDVFINVLHGIAAIILCFSIRSFI